MSDRPCGAELTVVVVSVVPVTTTLPPSVHSMSVSVTSGVPVQTVCAEAAAGRRNAAERAGRTNDTLLSSAVRTIDFVTRLSPVESNRKRVSQPKSPRCPAANNALSPQRGYCRQPMISSSRALPDFRFGSKHLSAI